MSKYSVFVSRRADEMLIKHTRFLAQVSKSAARRFLKEFGEILRELEENPLRFPIEDDYDLPQGKYRKCLFAKRYKAIVTMDGDKVYLDTVLDCRQDNSQYQPK